MKYSAYAVYIKSVRQPKLSIIQRLRKNKIHFGFYADRRLNVPVCFFCFIGNCVFGVSKKEHTFIERMLDERVFEHDNKTLAGSEDIETFFAKTIVKWVIFI